MKQGLSHKAIYLSRKRNATHSLRVMSSNHHYLLSILCHNYIKLDWNIHPFTIWSDFYFRLKHTAFYKAGDHIEDTKRLRFDGMSVTFVNSCCFCGIILFTVLFYWSVMKFILLTLKIFLSCSFSSIYSSNNAWYWKRG